MLPDETMPTMLWTTGDKVLKPIGGSPFFLKNVVERILLLALEPPVPAMLEVLELLEELEEELLAIEAPWLP